MNSSNYDVVVVGAGAAGLTAAIGLARVGFSVAVTEAAAFPGAENWSGCVYFCENLAHPDVLGPSGVEGLAWERRLVERGFFGTDGHGLLGMTYRDPVAFRNCYTVLRPIYDHHVAQAALACGVTMFNETTTESLIRDKGRVIGVCTNRGPIYGDLVFLAEGDASHLVTREGYERSTDPREAPKFLQGIKQVIELPPGAIEENFKVGPEEGVAYEMLVRNGTLRGRNLRLNMGGFMYTNRQSLSLGLVLPADNLHEHFGGDPNLLIEWFENLPALRSWLRGGRPGAFGAKLIRGGGARDIPHLIDHGLAIGGAASAIGIDFPYPNFTGPATAMGLLLAQAARRIRQENGPGPEAFTRENLHRHYLEPLRRTHYWHDVEFLRRWPGYVKRTQVFFGPNIDLALGTAYLWTRPDRWFLTKWTNWLRLVLDVAGPGNWHDLRHDLRHLVRSLRLREVIGRPALGRLLLDGTVNALRDLFRKPRPNLPAAGSVGLHYSAGGGAEPSGLPPAPLRRWFSRFAPILASAAQRVYTNDDTPLADKLPGAIRLLVKQINLLDLLIGAGIALAAGTFGVWLVCWDRFLGLFRRPGKKPRGLYRRYAQAVQCATDLTASVGPAAAHWQARLANLAYHPAAATGDGGDQGGSHIHVLWPRLLQDKEAIAKKGLWHVCPAQVYEARVSPLGQLQVVVNFENCIKCETCWRTSDLVDWGRDGRHRFVYPVHSPVVPRLLEAVNQAGTARPVAPRALDYWQSMETALGDRFRLAPTESFNGDGAAAIRGLQELLVKLERKLVEFNEALGEEPRTIDRARSEYLEMLARYAQQLAARVVEELNASVFAESTHPGVVAAHQQMLEIATALLARAEERSRRSWDQRFAWAAADGRQIRQHHLAGLQRCLAVLRKHMAPPYAPLAHDGEAEMLDRTKPWLRAEDDAAAVAGQRARWSAQLDAVFPAGAWHDRERQVPLTSEQDAVLRDLMAQVPAVQSADLAATLHPPVRKALLAELGRRDPSLAYRVASHLWARDLAHLASGQLPSTQAVQRWTRGEEWACFALIDAAQAISPPVAAGTDEKAAWAGEALLVPAAGARSVLLLLANQLAVVPADAPGLRIEPLPTLGLRGAGLARVRLDGLVLPDARVAVDQHRFRRVWNILAAADLTSIAAGMAETLCRRAIDHATSRVQFPGLFHDEEARDPIGKFGAVKKMIADMAARRYLIDTLDHALSPTDFSGLWLERSGLVKAVVAEALGTAPGSLSYNAGQVFGGTGYSEDDILSKFYRDAAAWKVLGPPDVEVRAKHGHELLRTWRADGHRLATLLDEGLLFEQLAQRKALQAELDEIRNLRSRLRGIVGDWQGAENSRDEGVASEFSEALARQDGHLLASKALLLRTHARLEQGLDAEVEVALLRVWLENVALALDAFENLVRRRLDPATAHADRPVVEPGAGAPVTAYADYLAADCPYDSGDFLATPVDLLRPRLVPEMVESDPALAASDRQFKDLLSGYFGRPRGTFTLYERYIESRHRMDPADLDFCRRHGFLRMPIPRSLGGDERSKMDYYLLTTNAQRLADVAVSLTIQANTSIGTTPVLLARDKDLPKSQKDLKAFVEDQALQQEIQAALEGTLKAARVPDPKRVEKGFGALQNRLHETVFARTVLKMLAYRFLEAWQKAGRAGRDYDLPAMRSHLEEALAAWQEARERAPDLLDELARRREACDLFLRWVASGQISAFALTEPSAGSDTARVATRARLCSVPVERTADGILRFVPLGGKEPRYLVDARRVEFRGEDAFYRWSETADPGAIRFDDYDYETDDPARTRSYDHGGQRVHFTDIAQVRERDGGLWYDYWELTGAKMWITNGRMAGVMCLYAKTEQGVTGFMVDRHAEGLVVGKDEDKMGQRGSATNELSLQAVRVPRENVIGLEGRGQVNALETLNVGRAGLAMSAMAQMQGLIDGSRACARETYGTIPAWAAWRLRCMEEDRFTAEALAFEVVGRFEHPQTRSVRMESAISKMLVSELLHHVIELAEEIHGPAGQTQLHLVEKRKRDARVLNIYEGTNEIQRFFILKDLAAEVAPRWAQQHALPPQHTGREALELEALKGSARQRIEAALAMFGQELWQNPNLQANCFLLAEAAAWLKAADSTLGRLAWLSRQAHGADGDENAEPAPTLALAQDAFARCGAEVRERLQRFDEELAHLRRGYYAPEVRAAALLFDRNARTPPPRRFASTITRPLSVLVVVEPTAARVPHPQVAEGRILEPHLTLNEGDRSALETALRLRDEAVAPVTIGVAAVAQKGAAQVLRELLALGVDRARLVVPADLTPTPDSAAAALVTALGAEARFDLILGGSSGPGFEEGLLARLTAEALGVPHAGSGAALAVQHTDEDSTMLLVQADRPGRTRPLPAAVAVEPGLPLRAFRIGDSLAAVEKQVQLQRWPKRIPVRSEWFMEGAPAPTEAAAEKQSRVLAPPEAARQMLREMGLSGTTFATNLYEQAIEDVSHPALLDAAPASTGRVIAVLAATPGGLLKPTAAVTLRAAEAVAETWGLRLTVLLLAPTNEEAQRRCLAQVLERTQGDAVVLATDAVTAGVEVMNQVLLECWPTLAVNPTAVVGEPWAESALASLSHRSGKNAPRAFRVRRLGVQDGRLFAETARAGGNLSARQTLELAPAVPSTADPKEAVTCWITLAEEAEVAHETKRSSPEFPLVQRWTPRLDRFYGRADIQRLVQELKQETGMVRLADADFIVDVGFGVGNRDGYDEVIEPLIGALRDAGVRNLVVGGSRKVTEELHLLPADRQIGQSGASVNPRVLLAVGISGAPQHLAHIGPRAMILAFNRDASAPIMTLNQRQLRPRVFPIVGDLFETVPAFIAALRKENAAGTESAEILAALPGAS